MDLYDVTMLRLLFMMFGRMFLRFGRLELFIKISAMMSMVMKPGSFNPSGDGSCRCRLNTGTGRPLSGIPWWSSHYIAGIIAGISGCS